MTVGIVGAGQLGRMMALAGYPLGLDCLFLDRSADAPAARLAPALVGEFTDPVLLGKLAQQCDVISFDWENISVEALRDAVRGRRVRIAPPLRALAAAQDRLAEKRIFERLGIPTTRHMAVDSRAALARAVARIGLPGVLKTRRMGYDGKGQTVLRKPADIDRAWEALGTAPLIYEEFVPFDAEVSAIGVRSTRGETAFYGLCRNHHVDGILRLTLAPHGQPALERRARTYLRRILEAFGYTGVLTVEFFVRQGRLIANEMAPRVHNSGHWTIEGAVASQFENHLRAILGLPLGSTRSTGHAAMINLIGAVPPASRLLAFPELHLHDYGKTPRPGRKVGHCTIVCPDRSDRDRRARRLMRQLYPRITINP